jgi:nucleotide-binding universal stress UspA family protein
MSGGMGSILTATDFSSGARDAAMRAARLAAACGAELNVLHVVSQGALQQLRELVGMQAAAVEEQVMREARMDLERFSAELETVYGRTPGVKLMEGSVASRIADEAEASDAGLLVLGAHGAGMIQRLILGSTAERVLRKTRRPLLLVKQPSFAAYRRVVIPVDFSAWSRAAVDLARSVAPEAAVALLHAYEVPFEGKLRHAGVGEDAIKGYRLAAQHEALQKMTALAEEAGLDPAAVEFNVCLGDPSQQIVAYEQETDCDLIVIGKHGRNRVEAFLLGSATKHVLAESGCDVLISTAEG